MRYQESVTLKNGKPCLIRSAIGDNAQAVYDSFLRTHDETDFLACYRDETDFDVAFEREFLLKKEASEQEVFLCAVVDGKIAGTAAVNAVGKNKVAHRAALGISIEKEYWSMGIGRALMSACIACAKRAEYAQLELQVVAENQKAVALYEKFGFTEYGRDPRGLRSRYTGWQELVLMRLEF